MRLGNFDWLTRMKVQMFAVGKVPTNCYIVSCEETGEAAIIDPAFDRLSEAEEIFGIIDEACLKLRFIVNTHGHPDHTCGNGIIKEKFSVPILVHEKDAHFLGETGLSIAQSFGFGGSPPADVLLQNGDLVKFGKVTLKVVHTPGHSLGGISLVGGREVFTGDTLFKGSIGRTDFPDSSKVDMKNSLAKLARLSDSFVVYPGHGLTTTISEEKRSNPFLQ
jgi:glyoxylase-like metal-dependent hydrolase (beta-lactamase superfamily II)